MPPAPALDRTDALPAGTSQPFGRRRARRRACDQTSRCSPGQSRRRHATPRSHVELHQASAISPWKPKRAKSPPLLKRIREPEFLSREEAQRQTEHSTFSTCSMSDGSESPVPTSPKNLGVARSTAYRTMQTLTAAKFIEEDPSGRFRLGLNLFGLSRLVRRSDGRRQSRRRWTFKKLTVLPMVYSWSVCLRCSLDR